MNQKMPKGSKTVAAAVVYAMRLFHDGQYS